MLSLELGFDCSGAYTGAGGRKKGITAEVTKELKTAWGAEQWDRLERMNQLDSELFQHGLLLRFITAGLVS